ncbi:uncharacterized protein LOC120105808 isoform X2 [Phoenix dactylifera]|uniref:Uncharacterized protein LOC120105808 isoform X2 n=1 Tax=Phoenix dactylifera TaxID=42345 RepID=A0A8B8ZSS7_PHODC|nr:uncharacterized protein LOC120105808 isoform X2 [Phoenix dactylifera]
MGLAHQMIPQTSSLFGEPRIDASMEKGLTHAMGSAYQMMPRTSSLFGEPSINASMEKGLTHAMGSAYQMMPRTSSLFGEPSINASMENQMRLMELNVTRKRGTSAIHPLSSEESKFSRKKR